MEQYTIYCTKEQVKKAWKLGAPIDIEHEYDEFGEIEESSVITPTAEQMIGWLEENGIDDIRIEHETYGWCFHVFPKGDVDYMLYDYKKGKGYSSRKEASLLAIDVSLEYLTNNKQ